MDILILDHAEVRRLLSMAECIEQMDAALRTLSAGGAVNPLRSATWLPDRRGLIGVMPGYLSEPEAFGLKVVTVFPGNHATPYDSHQGAVMLFDPEHGQPLALIDAGEITAIRTAAASAVATRALARADAGDLAIIGSGVQAEQHLAAMRCVRDVARVRVWSRSAEKAAAFAARHEGVEVAATAADAVRDADLVCTVTGAMEPVVEGAWLAPGVHVNAVGACFRAARELDTAAYAGARVYTDCRESALNEAGGILIPIDEGAFGHGHLRGEVGAVLAGAVPGRTSDADRTLYESLGVAVEDLASAHAIHRAAVEQGIGTRVTMGRRRDE